MRIHFELIALRASKIMQVRPAGSVHTRKVFRGSLIKKPRFKQRLNCKAALRLANIAHARLGNQVASIARTPKDLFRTLTSVPRDYMFHAPKHAVSNPWYRPAIQSVFRTQEENEAIAMLLSSKPRSHHVPIKE